MEYENYFMKKANKQGYRILDCQYAQDMGDDKTANFEWALIDRGEGRTPCVAHWATARYAGIWEWELEDITWSYGHYFNTLEEAEVYYREQLVEQMQSEIWELKERLEEECKRLREARKRLPEEEE